MERWMMLEERNERLFVILGAIGQEAQTDPKVTYSVKLVFDILKDIVGEVKGEK